MEIQDDDQNVDMEDVSVSDLSDEHKCIKIKLAEKQFRIFNAREKYVTSMLGIEKESHNQATETAKKLEEETASILEKIAVLER
ncbi:hypothetical protein TNCT_293201 [Trichonephila clavata]|uniref:Uncharacterized protein n=1 Tax=Trichonephila clavata TaxID=2740835 RepID=A0A8X6J3N9_TRICU|nr:hypothetical protein TNCT_293201 [Trichonephila clavata]